MPASFISASARAEFPGKSGGSGVVLRGQGQGVGPTKIHAPSFSPLQLPLIGILLVGTHDNRLPSDHLRILSIAKGGRCPGEICQGARDGPCLIGCCHQIQPRSPAITLLLKARRLCCRGETLSLLPARDSSSFFSRAPGTRCREALERSPAPERLGGRGAPRAGFPPDDGIGWSVHRSWRAAGAKALGDLLFVVAAPPIPLGDQGSALCCVRHPGE